MNLTDYLPRWPDLRNAVWPRPVDDPIARLDDHERRLRRLPRGQLRHRGCRVTFVNSRAGGNLKLSNSTYVTVPWNYAEFDTDDIFDEGTGQISIPDDMAGVYDASLLVNVNYAAGSVDWEFQAYIQVNGANDGYVILPVPKGLDRAHITMPHVLDLLAGDVVTVRLFQGSDTPPNSFGVDGPQMLGDGCEGCHDLNYFALQRRTMG
jgi:hypothetical protein